MDIDPRDAVWAETHDLLYNARYTAGIEQALLARWTWLDSITKIAVAISSGGGALAGLVFWKNSDYTFLWPVFTSGSALLAIVSRQLSVAEKINRHATAATSLTLLAVNIEKYAPTYKKSSTYQSTLRNAEKERSWTMIFAAGICRQNHHRRRLHGPNKNAPESGALSLLASVETGYFRPAAARRMAALSVRSHENSGSSRPKWP